MCVFGGVRTEGRFNLIVLPDPGSFTSKDISERKIQGDRLESSLGKIAMFVLPHALLFSFVKKYLILYC